MILASTIFILIAEEIIVFLYKLILAYREEVNEEETAKLRDDLKQKKQKTGMAKSQENSISLPPVLKTGNDYAVIVDA